MLEYARAILNELRSTQVRAELDDSTDKINGKIQRAEQMKVHTMLVIGKRDLDARRGQCARSRQKEISAPDRATEFVTDLLLAIGKRVS